MVGAGTRSGLKGAPYRNLRARGGFDVVEGTLRGPPAYMFICSFGNRTALTAPYWVLLRKCFLPCHRTCDLASRLSLLSQPLRLLFLCLFIALPRDFGHGRVRFSGPICLRFRLSDNVIKEGKAGECPCRSSFNDVEPIS
jgi:hypothetical protein